MATPSWSYASLFMLVTNEPARALGRCQGWDRILTPVQLAEKVADGAVRFFLFGSATTVARRVLSQDATADLASWVRVTCAVVPAELWQFMSTSHGLQPGLGGASTGAAGWLGGRFGPGRQSLQLFDCGGPGSGA